MRRDLAYPTTAIGPATLCLIENAGNVLIIDKKRGPGSEWYNFPGGKIDENESPRSAASRETKEETGLSVWNLHKYAELFFSIDGKPFSNVHVYKTRSFAGTPCETAEAVPEWVPYDSLPLDAMWPTDAHWIPYLRTERSIVGRFELSSSKQIENVEIQLIREFPLY